MNLFLMNPTLACGYRFDIWCGGVDKHISEEYIVHLFSHTLAPGLKKVKEYGNILSVGMRHLSQRIQSWLKGWISPPSGRVVALK